MTRLEGNNGQLLPDDVAPRHETLRTPHSRHILASHRVEILIVPRYGYVSLVWTPASAHSSSAHEPGRGNEREIQGLPPFLFLPLSSYPPTISFTRAKKHAYNTTNEYNSLAATVTPYRFALCYRSIIPTRFHLSHPALFTRRTTVNPSFSLSAPSPDTTLEQLRSRFLSTDPVPESGTTTHARTHEGGFGDIFGEVAREARWEGGGGCRAAYCQNICRFRGEKPRRAGCASSGLHEWRATRMRDDASSLSSPTRGIIERRSLRDPDSLRAWRGVVSVPFQLATRCFRAGFFLLFYEKDLVLFNLDMAIWN